MKKELTLTKILVAILIIAILVVVVLSFITSEEKLPEGEEGGDSLRESHLSSLEKGLYDYKEEKQFPTDITRSLIEICDTEAGANCGDLVDLSVLDMTIPADPQGGVDDNGTGYFVAVQRNKVYLHAPKAENKKVVVGDILGLKGYGGYIAYADDSYTLVAAEKDAANEGVEWGCSKTKIGKTGEVPQLTALGSGQENTSSIVIQGCAGPGIAAYLCDNLSRDGYEDWFLPSKDELNEIHKNLSKKEIGNFSSSNYWSSSQEDKLKAWSQYLGDNGDQSTFLKTDTLRVRCARTI